MILLTRMRAPNTWILPSCPLAPMVAGYCRQDHSRVGDFRVAAVLSHLVRCRCRNMGMLKNFGVKLVPSGTSEWAPLRADGWHMHVFLALSRQILRTFA